MTTNTPNATPTSYSAYLLHAVDQAQSLGLCQPDKFDLLRRVYAGAENQQSLVRRIADTARTEDLRQDQIALLIAVAAHAGQPRQSPHWGTLLPSDEPYVAHVMRVAFRFAETEVNTRAVALLHDVVEDCHEKGWTLDALAVCGINEPNIHSIDLVTKIYGPGFSEDAYFAGIVSDPVALDVKIEDHRDNSDVGEWIKAGLFPTDGSPPTPIQSDDPDQVAHGFGVMRAYVRKQQYQWRRAYMERCQKEKGYTPALRAG
ncbi:MAG: hypothetical protein JO126_01335 [Alphaproteobacteria bacterium]|nr:hypothetical protein [Alphaproteobacteria bacterium]MBV8548082.1 hypothetical protein [Alphaproteobacteria bacterium]